MVLSTLDHEIGVEEENRRPEPVSIRRASSLQMTKSGEQTTVIKKSIYRLTPEVNVMGNGGLGKDVETTQKVTSRWTFTRQLRPGKAAAYRTLKWELSENERTSNRYIVIPSTRDLHLSMIRHHATFALKLQASCRECGTV
ncbi:hypothetical protein VC83_08568 [Pseudogymnoascus destructans]|uniref:Uncharacterized protein n=2 Tax=Pseudogymnoascus destructans TaxID=655981 RepID=L8FQA5_PSED2|nr:uncharacterized protein VC83_08568 [Pseudogymnoascus destructans]ELR03077.1 hypothetical protein GMDG_05921 [Pseudogymnoascus destructans 20631-21]OAF54940.1 hypothetical protein VC83_08568 [Pseudogymnoascus destructans]